MDQSPDIVPISRFRDDIAGAIARANEDRTPVFITQNGRLTAVLLSRERYDELLDLLAERDDAASGVKKRRHPRPRDRAVGGFPPTQRRTYVDTLYGLVDPETAAFFAEEGIWTEDQGGPPPPYPWQKDAVEQSGSDSDEADSVGDDGSEGSWARPGYWSE